MTMKNISMVLPVLVLLAACGQQATSDNQVAPPVNTSGQPDVKAADTAPATQAPVVASVLMENAEPEKVNSLFEIAALYHSINPERPVQYEALIQRLNLPYTSDPNEKEKLIQQARANIDQELKVLPTSRLRFMELGYQTTPLYDKELGGMAVSVPEILYVTDSIYQFEVTNKKRFTFIPLSSPEEIQNADQMGFNKRKNSFVNMNVTFKVLEKKASGLSAGTKNKVYVELKSIEFLTQKDIPIFTFKGN